MPQINPIELRWRTGSKNPQIIQAQLTAVPSDTDPVIGMMNSVQLSREAVAAHNALLDRK